MRSLKLSLLLELELGVVWTILICVVPSQAEALLTALFLCLPIYAMYLVCMIIGGIAFAKRPDTRPLAAAVLTVPIALLILPALLRMGAGGAVPVPPAAWLLLVAIPLGACLFLPHYFVEFLPRWTLRCRWLNVSTVVLLAMMIVPWAGLFLVAPAYAHGGGEPIEFSETMQEQAPIVLSILAFAALSALTAALTFLTSYLGLFQREERSNHKLRVAQVILSLVVLAPSAVVLVVGTFLLAVAMAPLG